MSCRQACLSKQHFVGFAIESTINLEFGNRMHGFRKLLVAHLVPGVIQIIVDDPLLDESVENIATQLQAIFFRQVGQLWIRLNPLAIG